MYLLMRLEDVVRTVAKDLYRAEVRRQSIGWDEHCTRLLVRSQHALAAALNEGEPMDETPGPAWVETEIGMLPENDPALHPPSVERNPDDSAGIRDESDYESPTTPPPTLVACLCGKMLVVPGTRSELGGISHGVNECYRCTLKGERLRTPPDVGDLWASPEGVRVWDGENWLDPKDMTMDPPCKCGHPKAEHFQERNSCMVSGEEKTWACACTQYRPEREDECEVCTGKDGKHKFTCPNREFTDGVR